MPLRLLLLFTLLLPAFAMSAPRIPAHDDEVLEELPPRRVSVQATMPAAPATQAQLLADTLALLQLAQREGDPRYLGYAEAQLRRLPSNPGTWLLRARLRQATHHFPDALADLQRVLQEVPDHSEALLLQASIHQVRGDYALARASCLRITQLELLQLALACRAQVDGLSGKGDTALRQLQGLAALDTGLTPDQRTWIQLALGDLATRLGQPGLAGAAYRAVQDQGPDARTAYADWLLANGHPAAVVALLRGDTRHDGLLLRLALAEKRLGLPAARLHAKELARRFAALSARGEPVHLREEAMFALDLQEDSARALQLARSNWTQQREPADLLVYYRAAQARRSAPDLSLLQEWQRTRRLQDGRLPQELAAR